MSRISKSWQFCQDWAAWKLVPILPKIRRVMEKREKSQRERLLEETAGVCVYCGHPLTVETMETDHIVPKSKGGTGDYLNKVCACGCCNAAKANLDIRGFLAGFSGRRRRHYENRLDTLVEQGRMSAEKRALLSDFQEEEPFPEKPFLGVRGTVLFCIQLC